MWQRWNVPGGCIRFNHADGCIDMYRGQLREAEVAEPRATLAVALPTRDVLGGEFGLGPRGDPTKDSGSDRTVMPVREPESEPSRLLERCEVGAREFEVEPSLPPPPPPLPAANWMRMPDANGSAMFYNAQTHTVAAELPIGEPYDEWF